MFARIGSERVSRSRVARAALYDVSRGPFRSRLEGWKEREENFLLARPRRLCIRQYARESKCCPDIASPSHPVEAVPISSFGVQPPRRLRPVSRVQPSPNRQPFRRLFSTSVAVLDAPGDLRGAANGLSFWRQVRRQGRPKSGARLIMHVGKNERVRLPADKGNDRTCSDSNGC
jgi:hypothetical protein